MPFTLQGQELASVFLNTEDEEYEDEEDDEDSEDSDFDIVHEGELVPHLLIETLSTQSEGTDPCKEEETSSPTSSLFRLEPITSLFHSPSQDTSGSSPETEGEGRPQSPTSASPQTATSVCEVVIA